MHSALEMLKKQRNCHFLSFSEDRQTDISPFLYLKWGMGLLDLLFAFLIVLAQYIMTALTTMCLPQYLSDPIHWFGYLFHLSGKWSGIIYSNCSHEVKHVMCVGYLYPFFLQRAQGGMLDYHL